MGKTGRKKCQTMSTLLCIGLGNHHSSTLQKARHPPTTNHPENSDVLDQPAAFEFQPSSTDQKTAGLYHLNAVEPADTLYLLAAHTAGGPRFVHHAGLAFNRRGRRGTRATRSRSSDPAVLCTELLAVGQGRRELFTPDRRR